MIDRRTAALVNLAQQPALKTCHGETDPASRQNPRPSVAYFKEPNDALATPLLDDTQKMALELRGMPFLSAETPPS